MSYTRCVVLDKYNLNLEKNIFLAKKKIVQSIYDSARLEGCNASLSQVELIVNRKISPNIDIVDLQKVLNLRNAWQHILRNSTESLSFNLICKLNGFVAYNESLEWVC